jgi:hypothetical protein
MKSLSLSILRADSTIKDFSDKPANPEVVHLVTRIGEPPLPHGSGACVSIPLLSRKIQSSTRFSSRIVLCNNKFMESR